MASLPAGTAVFVLNIGSKSEVWSGDLGSPKGAAQGGFMAQGPIAVSAYGMNQTMPVQPGYMPAHQAGHMHLLFPCLCSITVLDGKLSAKPPQL